MFHLIEPDLGRVSGGLRYNWAVLEASDGQLQRHSIAGSWPDPGDCDLAALTELIGSLDGPVLLDGLIGCSLSTPLAVQTPVVQLVHALATTPKAQRREQQGLRAADAVVATSQYAADNLWERHRVRAIVASPGVQRRAVAAGGAGGNLISVGAVEPNKNQLFIANLLRQLHSRGITGWHCTFAGPLNDPAYAQHLTEALQPVPDEATTIAGELDETGLAALYDQADLLLLPSYAETFGMVVREATAAGIPAFVTAGTGAEEALGGGEALPLDAPIWVQHLQRWLTDPQYRRRLQTAARTARDNLSYGWHATAHTILEVLRAVSAQ